MGTSLKFSGPPFLHLKIRGRSERTILAPTTHTHLWTQHFPLAQEECISLRNLVFFSSKKDTERFAVGNQKKCYPKAGGAPWLFSPPGLLSSPQPISRPSGQKALLAVSQLLEFWCALGSSDVVPHQANSLPNTHSRRRPAKSSDQASPHPLLQSKLSQMIPIPKWHRISEKVSRPSDILDCKFHESKNFCLFCLSPYLQH